MRKAKDKEDPSKESIEVDVDRFDLKTTDTQGKVIEFPSVERPSPEILSTLKLKTSRAVKRQFEINVRWHLGSKTTKMNQLYNLMSSVLKTTSEMRSGTVRNML